MASPAVAPPLKPLYPIRKPSRIPLISAAIVFYLMYFEYQLKWDDYVIWSIIFLIWSLLRLADDFGTRFTAIFPIITTLAIIQWWFGPVYGKQLFEGFYLECPIDKFGEYVMPASIAFVLGMYALKQPNIGVHEIYDKIRAQTKIYPYLGVYLMVIGVVTGGLASYMPGALAFVFTIMGNMTLVGFGYIVLSPIKNKTIILSMFFLLNIAQVLATGMFGEFIFMFLLLLVVLLPLIHIPFPIKVIAFVIGGVALMILQGFKVIYRELTWTKPATSQVSSAAMTQLAWKKTKGHLMRDPDFIVANVVTRASQGAAIASVIRYVPNGEPYANGETLLTGSLGAFIPRLFWPNKPKADNTLYIRFTGRDPGRTAFGVTPPGEMYANFGKIGGCIGMFFYGLLISYILQNIYKNINKTPTLVLWIPAIFLHAIKVETDTGRVLNNSIKTLFFVWLFYIVVRKIFKIKI